MKRFLYSLTLLLAVMTSAAQQKKATINPDFKAEKFLFYYDSYDAQKNKVRLSGKIYYANTPDPVTHVILSCHPTTTSNFSAPSGPDPMDKEFSRMCYDTPMATPIGSCILICPDYCGYGVSSHLQHPYLIHDITARNCFDALLPAIQAAVDRGITFYGNTDNKVDGATYVNNLRYGKIPERLSMQIVGYSQGGATALACAKLYDSNACPADIHEAFMLLQTVCGDGPYSIRETMNQYMEWGNPNRPDGGLDLAYPCVLPLIVAAAKEANNDGCMRTVEVKDYFNPKFLATGILDLLKTKNVGTDVLNAIVEDAMPRRRPVDILSRNIINDDGTFNTATKEYKCFMRAIDMADLCTGWEPKHGIIFYHIDSDDVVPYVNYSKGIMGDKGIGKLYPKYVHYYTPGECWKSMANIVAIFKEDFDVYPDWSTMKHDVGGTYFYASFMFGVKLNYFSSGNPYN